MKPVKTGIVGCGNISSAHINALLKNPGFELAALCDVKTEMAERRRDEQNLDVEIHDDYNRLLERQDIDALSICTPAFAHSEIATAALEQNKNVLCEKPMTTSMSDAKRILSAAKESKGVFVLNHTFLFNPMIQKILEELDTGVLGRVFTARIRSANFLQPEEHPHYFDPSTGGVLLDLGYHPTYLILRILGFPRRVFARSKGLVFDGTYDNAVIFSEHEDGWGIIEASFTSRGPLGGTRPINLFGTKGTLIANFVPKAEIRLYPEKGEASTPEIPPGNHWTNLYRHFHGCITGKETPISGAEEGFRTMQIIMRALESSRSGCLTSLATE